MTHNQETHATRPGDDIDELETKLEQADAADAPETAEQVAHLLGNTLDDIDGGSGGGAP